MIGCSQRCGCTGSGARRRFGVQAAPTSASLVTMLLSRRPSRFGGQLSRNVVYFGSRSARWARIDAFDIGSVVGVEGCQNQPLLIVWSCIAA